MSYGCVAPAAKALLTWAIHGVSASNKCERNEVCPPESNGSDGQVCDETIGRCKRAPECMSDAVCPDEELCNEVRGKCEEKGECLNDDDCPDGQACDANASQCEREDDENDIGP